MCKSAPLPPTPTTEVADKIEKSTSVDNSWSFVNLHLPSTITTAVVILFMMIAAWILFRIYSRYHGLHPQTTSGQTTPFPPTLASTPWPTLTSNPWPTPTSTPALTSTPLMLDMEKLISAVAHQPGSTTPTPIQAKGPPPLTALFP